MSVRLAEMRRTLRDVIVLHAKDIVGLKHSHVLGRSL
jgi:hypothetical protein